PDHCRVPPTGSSSAEVEGCEIAIWSPTHLGEHTTNEHHTATDDDRSHVRVVLARYGGLCTSIPVSRLTAFPIERSHEIAMSPANRGECAPRIDYSVVECEGPDDPVGLRCPRSYVSVREDAG